MFRFQRVFISRLTDRIVRSGYSVRFYYVLVLALVFPVLDMLTAWLYGGGFPQAVMLRGLRDASIAGMAMLCLGTVRLPRKLAWPVFAYFAFVALYLAVGVNKGVALAVALPSSGTLVLPVLLFLTGYYCLRSERELRIVLWAWIALGLASTFLGMWDINHTEFWTDTVHLPEYMVNVKGVELGLEPETQLPWNFFVSLENMDRRAGGLLAAPLAQGSFLAVAAVMSLALLGRRWRVLGVSLAGIMTLGIWQSGTRGALIVEVAGVLGLMAANSGLMRVSPQVRRSVTAVLAVLASLAVYLAIQTSFARMDGSTVGHWDALMTNLSEFPRVLLFGDGVGRQGAIAAQSRVAVIGGGEGAFFSIAFQLGLPGALAFLWFYVNCIRLLAAADDHRRGLDWALAVLMAGFATTFVTSEHILTLSGMAAPWLLTGGLIRSARCRAALDAARSGAAQPLALKGQGAHG